MPGIKCPFLAAGGSPAMSKSQVWVDTRLFPSGIFTCRGLLVGQMFVTFALVVKKLLVAPESRIALLVLFALLFALSNVEFNI